MRGPVHSECTGPRLTSVLCMRHLIPPSCTVALAVLLVACGRADTVASDSAAASSGGTVYAYQRLPLDTTRAPGAIIDSTFPMPEQMRRFRHDLPAVATLIDGAPSIDSLVTRFIGALARGDRTALGRLTLSRAEFAWLYYPALTEQEGTTVMPPTLRWDGIVRNSEKGIMRALSRIGGRSLTLRALQCPPQQVRTLGDLRLHDGCRVTVAPAGDSLFTGRLFGPVIEHRGRFKFVGYANDM